MGPGRTGGRRSTGSATGNSSTHRDGAPRPRPAAASACRRAARVQLVGDALVVTNPAFIRRAIDERALNAVLIKLNQIGTLTEQIGGIETERSAGGAQR